MGEYQRLKQLLLQRELDQLDEHAARVAALESARIELPAQLPQLLKQSQRGDGAARLADALAAPVASALVRAVREQRETIVDALFPVIGPAIRKAIAEALRDFSDGFNRALESSLTPRGLRWRLESWRTGMPYAQVVLRHNLGFSLDHVFLIDPASGLVLARESAAGLPDLDADAIAGMLTAIGDFVRDSVGRDAAGGDAAGLASATVGEHLVWLLEGPRANLAAFVRGVPPAALRLLLQQRLEQIHAQLDDPFAGLQAGTADMDAALHQALRLDHLDMAAVAAAATPMNVRTRRWLPGLAVLVPVVAGLAWWGWSAWRWQQRMDALDAVLHDWPGLHVDSLSSRSRRLVHLRGLIDSLADPPHLAMHAHLPDDVAIEFDLRGYVSTDDVIIARRAQQQLQPPPLVSVRVEQGVLRLTGTAPADWLATVDERGSWIVGVTSVDSHEMQANADPSVALRAELAAIARELDTLQVTFSHATEAIDTTAMTLIAAKARRALEIAERLGQPVRLVCQGFNDEPGGAALNQRLRDARAAWLCAQLQSQGVPEHALSRAGHAAMDPLPGKNLSTIHARAALLRLDGAGSVATHD